MEQTHTESSNDYHTLPVTAKQLSYARNIAERAHISLPDHALSDRHALSKWIDRHKAPKTPHKFDCYPSSKQIGFAELIARRKHRVIPSECFRDKNLMSRWIDHNC